MKLQQKKTGAKIPSLPEGPYTKIPKAPGPNLASQQPSKSAKRKRENHLHIAAWIKSEVGSIIYFRFRFQSTATRPNVGSRQCQSDSTWLGVSSASALALCHGLFHASCFHLMLNCDSAGVSFLPLFGGICLACGAGKIFALV